MFLEFFFLFKLTRQIVQVFLSPSSPYGILYLIFMSFSNFKVGLVSDLIRAILKIVGQSFRVANQKLGPYSSTIVMNFLSIVLHIFSIYRRIRNNTTSDWLNHIIMV